MVEPEKGAGTKFWDRRSKAKTSGKWSREIKSKNFALSSSSSFSETQRGYQKARTAEGHYTAFHGERCGIDPKLRPSTEDHPGPVYCDRTGRGTRPGYYPNRSGRVPKTSEDTTVRRVPGMPFGNATDIRHTLPPEPHERHVGKSFFEHIGRESGDIAKYATNPAGVRKPGDRNRFTALMWNKGYIPATEDACIVQDEVSPGPQKYQLDQFPIHPNTDQYSMHHYKPPIKFSQQDLSKSPYARQTNKLVHSSSFQQTVNKSRKPRRDRMSYMQEKGWGQVNQPSRDQGHPVFFQEWDKAGKIHEVSAEQRIIEVGCNQADIGQTYSLQKWAPVGTGGTLRYRGMHAVA